MAFGKAAICLTIAGVSAWAAQFTVRHEHWRQGCEGILTVGDEAISFAGPKGHAWSWKIQDLQELRLDPRSIHILTYKDSKLRLGADESYEFTGTIPVEELYAQLRHRMDQRLIAQIGQGSGPEAWSVPVKHLGRMVGSEGSLAVGDEGIVYDTPARKQARKWRYSDIENISSSGRFDLSITTIEKTFHFQLKQPISEARYNDLWLLVEKKNGRIQ